MLLPGKLPEEGGAIASADMGREMTGDELKAHRKRRGLSRRVLGAMARLHPDTVKYWERKASVNLRGYAPDRMLKALGLGELSHCGIYPSPRFNGGISGTNTRARDGVLGKGGTSRGKRRCGAQTRKGGPCKAQRLPGKTRCRFHGGMSTGPRTPEGRERIAAAQRRRWAKWRFRRREPEKA